jgi:hypothetical protein
MHARTHARTHARVRASLRAHTCAAARLRTRYACTHACVQACPGTYVPCVRTTHAHARARCRQLARHCRAHMRLLPPDANAHTLHALCCGQSIARRKWSTQCAQQSRGDRYSYRLYALQALATGWLSAPVDGQGCSAAAPSSAGAVDFSLSGSVSARDHRERRTRGTDSLAHALIARARAQCARLGSPQRAYRHKQLAADSAMLAHTGTATL